MKKEKKVRKRISGQSLIEYVLLVSLVAIGALVAISFFGSRLETTTSLMATGDSNMGGTTGGGTITHGAGITPPAYPQAYSGNLATAASVNGAYNAGSPKTIQRGFNTTTTVCASKAGATTYERCQRLQGLPVVKSYADGSVTTEYPDGSMTTVYSDGTVATGLSPLGPF